MICFELYTCIRLEYRSPSQEDCVCDAASELFFRETDRQ